MSANEGEEKRNDRLERDLKKQSNDLIQNDSLRYTAAKPKEVDDYLAGRLERDPYQHMMNVYKALIWEDKTTSMAN